jgi:hypothetical protein
MQFLKERFLALLLYFGIFCGCSVGSQTSKAEPVPDPGPVLNPQTEKVKTTSSELIVPAEDDQVFYYSSGMGKELIHIHMNPGASMYWYDTVISFGIGNEPEWKVENKHPSTLEEYMNSKYYWDKSTRTWKKQEYIREQEVPRE